MIDANVAMLVAGLSVLAVVGVGASIRRRLQGAPRRVEPTLVQSRTDDSSRAATQNGASRHRFQRSLARSRAPITVLAMVVGVFSVGPILVLLVLATWLSVGRSIPLIRRRQNQRAIEDELPGTIELLVLSIHAGLTPDQAIRELAHSANIATRPGFVEVVHRLDRGEPLADALSALPQKLGPDAVGLAEVIGSASRYGLPLSQVLEQLSGEARTSRRRLGEAAARRLPVRLSFPLVICTLPSFVLLTIAPAVIAALSSLGTSAG